MQKLLFGLLWWFIMQSWQTTLVYHEVCYVRLLHRQLGEAISFRVGKEVVHVKVYIARLKKMLIILCVAFCMSSWHGVLFLLTQLPAATRRLECREARLETTWSLPRLRSTSITPRGWEDWADPSEERTWEPGAQDTTITTSGSRWTLVDQWKSPR